MSMSMADWDKEIEKLDLNEAKKIKAALETLKEWRVFKEQFGWTLMFVLIPSFIYNIKTKEGK